MKIKYKTFFKEKCRVVCKIFFNPPRNPTTNPHRNPHPKPPYIYYMLINPYKTHTRINRIYVTYSTYSNYSVFLRVFAPFQIKKNNSFN